MPQIGENGCAYVSENCNIVSSGDDQTPTFVTCPVGQVIKVSGANCGTKNHGQDLEIDWAANKGMATCTGGKWKYHSAGGMYVCE